MHLSSHTKTGVPVVSPSKIRGPSHGSVMLPTQFPFGSKNAYSRCHRRPAIAYAEVKVAAMAIDTTINFLDFIDLTSMLVANVQHGVKYQNR